MYNHPVHTSLRVRFHSGSLLVLNALVHRTFFWLCSTVLLEFHSDLTLIQKERREFWLWLEISAWERMIFEVLVSANEILTVFRKVAVVQTQRYSIYTGNPSQDSVVALIHFWIWYASPRV